MEAAIAWLVQTILATLLLDKLDAWIQEVGLGNDIDKLKSEIQRVERMVAGVKGTAIGNDSLSEALARVKELLYEADDVVDELDYYRLQHQVQGVAEPDGTREAERVSEIPSNDADTPMNSSVGKLRSMVWEHFTITEKYDRRPIRAKCNQCGKEFMCDTTMNGTSSMKKHLENEHCVTCTKRPGVLHPPNPPSAAENSVIGSSSRRKGKKRRSKAWDLFHIIEEEENGEPTKARCKYCPTEIKCGGRYGTGGMLNHNRICKKKPGSNDQPPNPSSTGDATENVNPTVISDPSNRKRKRVDEDPGQITATNTHTPWDKVILSNTVQKITSQLQDIQGEVSAILMLHGPDFASCSNHDQSTAKGNPLAAVSTGELLRKKLNTDYWRNILENEEWKSMHLSRGIMTSLKLSYDQLPYHLQQCFSYCSIFPESYQFLGEELVSFWIAQRFVKCNNSSQSLEGIGRCYLIELVNLGFLEEVKREEPYLGNQVLYGLCGIMHDFSRMISRDDCASLDGMECNKMSQTLRHLSIVTGSACNKDQHGNIHRDEKFEENLRNAASSVSKLRTLVLLGSWNSSFLLLFQDIFQNAHKLRVLQMSATSAEVDGALPQVLSKLHHLQVLIIGSYTGPAIPDGISNLVSLRYFVVHSGVYSSIAKIDSMASFQEPHGFKFQVSSIEMTQLQCTDELVQHWMHVKTLEEVYEAGLRNNELSEKLIMSWMKTSAHIGMELDQLEPCQDVKDLRMSGYGAWSYWHEINIYTSFQTVHIYDCAEWKILPSLGRFPFLTRLQLSNLEELKEVLLPSLEELVLLEMPKLESCSCTSVEGMNSRLRVLQIEGCAALREFDLFENDDKFDVEQTSWLPGIWKLILRDCPYVKVLKPLPPSTTCFRLHIDRVSTLPYMGGSSSEELYIQLDDDNDEYVDKDDHFDEYSDELRVLDNKILAFHNLRNLKSMIIEGCQNLASISFEGLTQLLSLKRLELRRCILFSSDVMPQNNFEDVTATNCKAFTYLQSLSMGSCLIAGKWLSLFLRHAPDLEELHLEELRLEEEKEHGQSNRISAWDEQNDTLTGLAQDGLVHIPLNIMSAIKRITIQFCPRLTFNWSEEGFSGFTSLQELDICGCPELLSSFMLKDGNNDQGNGRWLHPRSLGISGCSQETLQPCFPRNLTSLKKLVVESEPDLESLQLHSCTALEELTIRYCDSLTALEGLQFLGSLVLLEVYGCPGLPPWLDSFSRQGYELFPPLKKLEIDDPSVLTTSFCEHLTSLRHLILQGLVPTEEQGRALVLLKSLQQLEFHCPDQVDLPAGLHLLPSLKRLILYACSGISRLQEIRLSLSLEEIEIISCSKELTDQCRLLATSKLNVNIIGCPY